MAESRVDVVAPTLLATPSESPMTVTDLRVMSPCGEDSAGAETLAPGHRLAGRYRIERFIARGGIGEVYAAEDALLGESVAVKLLRPEMSQKPGASERFATEIRLARKITHGNVCRVFDVGVDGDRLFYTMELHPGETLASRARAGAPFPPATVRPWLIQLLAGVAAAHAAGIVHTDLKPSNVLLTGERVVVTDFGLAVPCCATVGCDCDMPHLVGTPAYMAPEQVAGGSLTETTDVFSIGVILFELMTGRLPWTGASATELAHARLAGPTPSPRAHRPDLDPTWDQAIRACLRRGKADRPRTIAELAAMLELPGLATASPVLG